ncbi:MAG: four helix bundle protein [Elusimicrobiales bacterium]|nr:four helix bundle protein [Elusimicrobiales bacterium]MCK5583258.1 four helix bundle protein [Elusimicrobiales bacterium]
MINPKIQINSNNQKTKLYDLEERTFIFAKDTALFCKTLPRGISNIEYQRQVIRSSSSVGANYIEANESLGKKDFSMRIKISRKEAKESAYWFRLIIETNAKDIEVSGKKLLNEALELKKIFSSIINKTK